MVTGPEPAVLKCEVDLGDPKADCKWFKESKQIYPNKKYEISVTEETATLTIKDAQPNDSARYKFEAGNKLGFVETEAQLTVYSKCFFFKY